MKLVYENVPRSTSTPRPSTPSRVQVPIKDLEWMLKIVWSMYGKKGKHDDTTPWFRSWSKVKAFVEGKK